MGGENFPSGNIRKIFVLHLAQSKLISTTRGLTVLTFTTEPRTDTSLSDSPMNGTYPGGYHKSVNSPKHRI